MVPDHGYLKQAQQLLHKHRALLIADEVQTGCARTGKMLACDHDPVRAALHATLRWHASQHVDVRFVSTGSVLICSCAACTSATVACSVVNYV